MKKKIRAKPFVTEKLEIFPNAPLRLLETRMLNNSIKKLQPCNNNDCGKRVITECLDISS